MMRADRQQNADARAAGQARRDLRPQGPRAGLQRRRRHDRRGADRHRRSRPTWPRQVCGALDGCTAERQAAIAKSLVGARRRSPTSRARCRPTRPSASRALALPGITLLKESRRYYPNSELAAHVIGYVGLDNVGLGGIESAYDSQIRGKDGKVLIQTDDKRRALFSRVERPATAGAGIELTIDEYLQYVAERELRAGVEENHAHGRHARSSWIRTPARSWRWRTGRPSTRTRSRASDDDAQRNRAIQTLYEPGSTFKIVTASAALEQQRDHARDDGRHQPGLDHASRAASRSTTRTTTASSTFTDVIVKSSNVGAIKVGLSVGPAACSTQYVSRFGFGQTLGPDFRGETAGIVWSADAAEPERAGVGLDGLPGRRHAAADGRRRSARWPTAASCIQPRVVRAFIKDGRRIEVPHKEMRRTIEADTAATLTTIMEQVVERGTARAAQIRRLHDRRQDRHRGEARQRPLLEVRLQRVVRRLRAVAQAGADHSRRHRLAARQRLHRRRGVGAGLQAHRRSGAHLPRRRPEPQRARRRCWSRGTIRATTMPTPRRSRRARPACCRPRVEPARNGLMPDLRGLSAREALRALSRIGMTRAA